MERIYTTGTADSVTYFIGNEVERTPAYGQKTLFVVGVMAPEEITDIATKHECNHVYFGANQSFNGKDIGDWERMISHMLRLGFWATLDLDSRYCQSMPNWLTYLNTYDQFITMISVKVPNLAIYNKNATVKIDDIDFNASNEGVWCHSLTELKSDQVFTEWKEYGNDQIIEEKQNA